MKKISLFLVLFLIAAKAEAKISIFACEPEWMSLAKEIIQDKGQVIVASLANQNPADVEVKNSLYGLIRSADMVFCSGNGLEEKWLDQAISKSYSIKISEKKDLALLYAADYAVRKIQVKETTEKFDKRNPRILPRVHLNPYNIVSVATEFTRRIKILDPINAAFYQKSYEEFVEKWRTSIVNWERAASPLKGLKVVVSSDAWLQLADWLQLDVVATVNQKKSFVQNNQNLNEIIRTLKQNPADVIIFAAYEDKTPIMWLSQKSSTRMVLLPFTVGGAANSGDLFSMYATTINLLLADCSEVVCPRLEIPATIN